MLMAEITDHDQKDNDNRLIWSYHSSEATTERDSNASDIIVVHEPPCRSILYAKVGGSSVNVWDLMILVPNVLFLFFLVIKMRRACIKLRRNDSPMFSVCLTLVCLANLISLIRCIVSMSISVPMGTSDRAIWLLLKFFLLATELSVIVFGFMFGHLDSKMSIRRVLFVTFTVALAYSFTQGALEFFSPNETFHNITISTGNTYYLFGHGGMMFWFVSSVVLSAIYIIVCILPLTSLNQRCAIPSRPSFYVYCAVLAVLNTTQAVGCGLLYFAAVPAGWCIIDATAYLYFIGFAPLIYVTFLRSFFVFARQPKLSFSYQSQIDEAVVGEDTDSYPHHRASLYGAQPAAGTSINAADDETDEDGASGHGPGAPRNHLSGLHNWLHWHGVFVGVPEVKTGGSPRLPVARSTPSPLMRNDERH